MIERTVAETAVSFAEGREPIASLHERALPQKNNLCGPFWGALVLSAAGVVRTDGDSLDQDLVARRAGTTLPQGDPQAFVPRGASPRTDYRFPLPVEDPTRSGTSARRLGRAIEELSNGALAVLPVAGPWDAGRVVDLVDGARGEEVGSAGGVTLLANVRTGRLWGSRPAPALVLDHLAGLPVKPPAPEWDAGHFISLAGVVRGAGGALVVVADSYATLGWRGYHVQPPEVVVAALERGDGREGGVLCVAARPAERHLRARLAEAGFELRYWDNGTPDGKEEA